MQTQIGFLFPGTSLPRGRGFTPNHSDSFMFLVMCQLRFTRFDDFESIPRLTTRQFFDVALSLSRTEHYTQDIRSPLLLTFSYLAVVNSVPSVPRFGCFPGSFSDRAIWHKNAHIYADPCNLAQVLPLIRRFCWPFLILLLWTLCPLCPVLAAFLVLSQIVQSDIEILTYMLTRVIWLKSYHSSSAEEGKKQGVWHI